MIPQPPTATSIDTARAIRAFARARARNAELTARQGCPPCNDDCNQGRACPARHPSPSPSPALTRLNAPAIRRDRLSDLAPALRAAAWIIAAGAALGLLGIIAAHALDRAAQAATLAPILAGY